MQWFAHLLGFTGGEPESVEQRRLKEESALRGKLVGVEALVRSLEKELEELANYSIKDSYRHHIPKIRRELDNARTDRVIWKRAAQNHACRRAVIALMATCYQRLGRDVALLVGRECWRLRRDEAWKL